MLSRFRSSACCLCLSTSYSPMFVSVVRNFGRKTCAYVGSAWRQFVKALLVHWYRGAPVLVIRRKEGGSGTIVRCAHDVTNRVRAAEQYRIGVQNFLLGGREASDQMLVCSRQVTVVTKGLLSRSKDRIWPKIQLVVHLLLAYWRKCKDTECCYLLLSVCHHFLPPVFQQTVLRDGLLYLIRLTTFRI